MIPQTLKNLANDSDIAGLVPRSFPALELVAASTIAARQIAGSDEPDRHDFLEAIPKYLLNLPNSPALALEVIHMDAAAILGISGLVTDHARLTKAQADLSEAEAALAEAEAIQGRRLQRIHTLEGEIESCNRELESWDIDFDYEIAGAESLILEHWGKYNVNGLFDTIAKVEVLRRLAPGAITAIRQRLAAAEKEVAALRAKPRA